MEARGDGRLTEESGLQIYNNSAAFSVWKHYTENVRGLQRQLARLSSGLRISNAGDDPAGLSISERLRTQARNAAAASLNVENKINYLQTADAWLQKIHDLMGRMSELAIMAHDGTKSQVDRSNLQVEFAQMQKEVQRITSGATAAGKFNSLYLFRGGTGLAIPYNDGVAGHTEGGFEVVRTAGAGPLTHAYRAVYEMEQNRWAVTDTSTATLAGYISAHPRQGGSLTVTEGASTFDLIITTPTEGSYQDGNVLTLSAATIQNRPGTPEYASAGTQGSGALSVSGTGGAISASNWSATYDGSAWTLRNETTHVVERVVPAGSGAVVGMPFVEGANGFDVLINAPGGGTRYTAGDRFTWTNQPGGVGAMEFHDAHADIGAASVAVAGDGLDMSSATFSATYSSATHRWTVMNETTSTVLGSILAGPEAGGSLNGIEGANGFDFTIAAPTGGGYSTGDRFTWTNQAAGARYSYSQSLHLQVGPDSHQVFHEQPINLEATHFGVIGSYSAYSYGSVNLTLLGSAHTNVCWASLICGQHLSIRDQGGAESAVDKLNLGIDHLSSVRAVVGAEMRRMEQTLMGLRNYEENIRATESRIRDADIAYEASQYARYQILTQVGSAMLAQANSLPQSVLQLVG